MERKQLLEEVVKAIVSNKEAVKASEGSDEMGVLLTLDVAPEDMGKVIGKNGETAKAIRSVFRVIGLNDNARISIKINEPQR